jgi:hypothetical protein
MVLVTIYLPLYALLLFLIVIFDIAKERARFEATFILFPQLFGLLLWGY